MCSSDLSDKPRAQSTTVATVIGTQYANFSFQIQLFEEDNSTQFVYGAATAGLAAADFAKFVNVGVKGSAATASNPSKSVGSRGRSRTRAFSRTREAAKFMQAKRAGECAGKDAPKNKSRPSGAGRAASITKRTDAKKRGCNRELG